MKQVSGFKLPINPRYGESGLSWSDVTAIESNVATWYDNVINNNTVSSGGMNFGQGVHKLLEQGDILGVDIPRCGDHEVSLKCKIKVAPRERFMFLGRIDQLCDTIDDFKTCLVHWTEKQANAHGQLKAYAMLVFENHGVLKNGRIISILTNKEYDVTTLTGSVVIHSVNITKSDILKFRARAIIAYKKAKQYINDLQKVDKPLD